jgi:hypothetical protein
MSLVYKFFKVRKYPIQLYELGKSFDKSKTHNYKGKLQN